MLFFVNPAGLWALSALPVVLAIHMLRLHTRVIPVSTLFLIEQVLPANEGGRRIRRLRNSIPLWLQILAVLALCALLCGPRWIQPQSRQTIVVVFDDSASMSAFREAAITAAGKAISRFSLSAADTRWIFLRSDGVRLYSGTRTDMSEAMKSWNPARGQHDPSEALRLAETLAGKSGRVVFVTDHPPETDPAGYELISVGQPLENTGFCGVKVGEDEWSALLRNYGKEARAVKWREKRGETALEWHTEYILPGEAITLKGTFLKDADHLQLELENDAFLLDNMLPLVRPRPKILRIALNNGEKFQPLFQQILTAIPGLEPAQTKSDLTLSTYNPLTPSPQNSTAIVFVDDAAPVSKAMTGQVIMENHPLMENLNWQGLIAKNTLSMPFRKEDTTLLWQDEKPLIFLKNSTGHPQLVFNFDVLHSNVSRLPAFAILLHRFVESIRQQKEGFEAENFETSQVISIAGSPVRNAPEMPGFFQLKHQKDIPLLDGAAYFADPREADFSQAAYFQSAPVEISREQKRHGVGSFLEPIWAILAAACMIANWFVTGKRPAASAAMPRGSEAGTGLS